MACPVLVFPHPQADRTNDRMLQGTDIVMAITTHLAGDNSLVNNAAGFTNDGGTLWLAHVEDEKSFARFIDTISKIDAIDTDTSRERILTQMLKEPSDYIRSCKEKLVTHRPSVRIEKIVTVGSQLEEFRRLIDKYTIDLLVMHTKDADQSAMHGLAYPLAIELREIPLLLL
jgi:regulatory protein YycH of two-component signal transduction system YycFG